MCFRVAVLIDDGTYGWFYPSLKPVIEVADRRCAQTKSVTRLNLEGPSIFWRSGAMALVYDEETLR
jgi:hypothetical protein